MNEMVDKGNDMKFDFSILFVVKMIVFKGLIK